LRPVWALARRTPSEHSRYCLGSMRSRYSARLTTAARTSRRRRHAPHDGLERDEKHYWSCLSRVVTSTML
jgi:hypothetical protein